MYRHPEPNPHASLPLFGEGIALEITSMLSLPATGYNNLSSLSSLGVFSGFAFPKTCNPPQSVAIGVDKWKN
jgi:hypothetical protein